MIVNFTITDCTNSPECQRGSALSIFAFTFSEIVAFQWQLLMPGGDRLALDQLAGS
ncbi:hypothetical protein IQ225_13780 [Synechocystis salina LEGE 06155]|nr:hypothetical protein [Synechocystis salina LEGE 06155]